MDQRSSSDRIERRLSELESAVDEIRDALAHLARRPSPDASRQRPTEPAAGASPQDPRLDLRRAGPGRRAPLGLQRPRDLESWLGQNGLLVVGVLALVAAVGFTLKYAFDQGWISPAARVAAGLAAGLVVAAWGERLIRKGLARFGAGLQGAGAAIAYLSTWAAAGPYRFVHAGAGIGALAVISGLVLLSALRHSEAYLAGLAAAGAYLAPILLGDAAGTGDMVLAYSVLVSGAAAWVTVRRRWGETFAVVVLGYFLMLLVAPDPDAGLVALYTTLGGGALLSAAVWRGWHANAVLAWLLAWIAVFAGAEWAEGWRAWLFVVGPAALAWPVWQGAIRVGEETGARLHADEPLGIGSNAMFYGTAIAWAAAATIALPPPADAFPLEVALAIGLLFLAPGILRRNAAMHLAGLGAFAVGIFAQWSWLGCAAGLSVLAAFAALTTRSGPLAENRWTGSALAGAATYALFGANAEQRPAGDPALYGRWAGAMYLVVASAVGIAGPLWVKTEQRWERPGGFNLRMATWLLAAGVALSGGTIEIPAFVLERGGSELAAGLAVSAYWLVLAGGLLAYGFWKNVKAVRVTGLAVAGLAIGKVVFVDLAELRALYRVGSLALLAVIALVAARAYHRRGPSESPPREA